MAFVSLCLRVCDVGVWVDLRSSALSAVSPDERIRTHLCDLWAVWVGCWLYVLSVSLCLSVPLWFFGRHDAGTVASRALKSSRLRSGSRSVSVSSSSYLLKPCSSALAKALIASLF